MLPFNITISVTDYCNSRCKTCNIWKVRPVNELTCEEYKKIFKNFGRIFWLTITGGEPFIRRDLFDIIKTINSETKPNYITIATNGMLTKKIINDVKKILRFCPNITLIINLSIDGIGKQHDYIRGVHGNYKKTVKTFKELKKIKNKKLIVGINSVISRFNVKNFPKIYNHICNKLKPDSYIAEVAERRAKLYNLDLNITPEFTEYENALYFIIKRMIKNKRKDTPEIIRKLRIEFYKTLINNNFPPNYEGIASAYIMANGEVWISYSKRYVIGNLRDVNYDFKALWFSKKSFYMRKQMEKEKYYTMLANAFYTNIVFDPIRLFKILLS
jgi:MoaA/NifB/PqqE/SkfB family radical SAM enzyme